MSPDFKGIKSLRLEDSMDNFVQCINLFSFIIDGEKLYMCQLFDLS